MSEQPTPEIGLGTWSLLSLLNRHIGLRSRVEPIQRVIAAIRQM